jgi:hypothetical protein
MLRHGQGPLSATPFGLAINFIAAHLATKREKSNADKWGTIALHDYATTSQRVMRLQFWSAGVP